MHLSDEFVLGFEILALFVSLKQRKPVSTFVVPASLGFDLAYIDLRKLDNFDLLLNHVYL